MSYFRFNEQYRQVMEQASMVVEAKSRYRGIPIQERALRCLWYGRHLDEASLRTTDGEAVRVISPGWWNGEAGPDFLKSEIAFGEGEVERGDVEIHIQASGWYQHNHHLDGRYNQVKLHVVLWNDREDDFVVNEAGEPIRQLVIEDNLKEDLDPLLDRLNQDDFPQPPVAAAGLCHQYLEEGQTSRNWLGEILDLAGDERVLTKARAFARRSETAGQDQAFYEAFMAALGYKNNKVPFEKLARLVPLALVSEAMDTGPAAVQAILFRSSGLMPEDTYLPGMPDAPTWDLLDEYTRSLKKLPVTALPEIMDRTEWRLAGTRPMNSPVRRIAAACNFLCTQPSLKLVDAVEESLTAGMSEEGGLDKAGVREARRRLHDRLAPLSNDYWAYRYSFGGKASARPIRFIGEERLQGILINVCLPALLVRARTTSSAELESFLFQLYDQSPPLVETQITRFMAGRVFGTASPPNELVNSARRQQGLYQLYGDFESDDGNCEKCALAKAMLLAT